MKCHALYNFSAKTNSYYNEKQKKVKSSAIEQIEVQTDDVQWLTSLFMYVHFVQHMNPQIYTYYFTTLKTRRPLSLLLQAFFTSISLRPINLYYNQPFPSLTNSYKP